MPLVCARRFQGHRPGRQQLSKLPLLILLLAHALFRLLYRQARDCAVGDDKCAIEGANESQTIMGIAQSMAGSEYSVCTVPTIWTVPEPINTICGGVDICRSYQRSGI